MHYVHEVTIPVPATWVNLPDWLFGLTEEEYAGCARAHRAIGGIGGDRRLGMVNVESIGGSLLIQHYATRRADRDHVTMASPASRAYLMHVAPVRVGVTWDMQILADTERSSRFRCAIDVDMPFVVRALGQTIGTPWFVRRHLVEETIGFARDITRKSRNHDGTRLTSG